MYLQNVNIISFYWDTILFKRYLTRKTNPLHLQIIWKILRSWKLAASSLSQFQGLSNATPYGKYWPSSHYEGK